MSGTNLEHAEIRVVKKKKASHASHGGAWKVAYADFVTAMMALFIVLWIMSQSQSIRQSVAQYFKNPGILPSSTGLMETSDMGGKMPTPGHSQELQRPTPITPDVCQDRNSLEEVKKRIEEMIAQLPELQNLKDQVLMEITGEGLRIELLEQENSSFFDIGSANLKPQTKKILSLIVEELGRLPNRLTIEGHTDSRPYGNQSYTNWELSTDRANAARRLMETAGLGPGKVFTVRGFADRLLRNPGNPFDCQNRRVSIIVMFRDRKETLPLGGGNLPEPKLPAPGKPQGEEAKELLEVINKLPASVPKPEPKPPAPGKPQGEKAKELLEVINKLPASVPKPEPKPPAPGKPQDEEAKDLLQVITELPVSAPKGPADPKILSSQSLPKDIVSEEIKQKLQPFKPQDRLGW